MLTGFRPDFVMITWLRHNFGYKLLALVFACLLHFYVAGLINARPSHLLTLPITVRNLPPSLILDDSTLPSVTLTLDGPSDDISRLTDTSVTAWVDLSHARAGQSRPLPVHLSGLPPTITLENDPKPVTLAVQQRRRRQMAVSADDIGVAPSGYSFAPASVSPREAVITGTREAVSAAIRLVAQADPDQQPGAVDEDFPIIALDATGSPVSNVTVSPPTAHVRLVLTRALARKTLLVSASIAGTLPASYRFGSIEVSPAAVEAEGRPETLAAINTLSTQTIEVSGATADIVRRVQPVVPPGMTLSPRGPITVTIHVIAPPAAAPTVQPPAAEPSKNEGVAPSEGQGNLKYNSLAEFLGLLSEKIKGDAAKDQVRGRIHLAANLQNAAVQIAAATANIETAWRISEPHMTKNTPD